MKVLVLNGPNLNLLGKRETDIYGKRSFEDYLNELKSKFPEIQLDYFQSNIEGEIIDELHRVGFDYDGILLNAGGYTHTSVAIGDAVAGIESKVVEVHISNTFSRETYRHESTISKHAVGVICGMGLMGYEFGLRFLLDADRVD